MKQLTLARLLFAVAAALAAAPSAAQGRSATDAADFPNRPVRIILPTTAGSGVDITVRIIAQKLVEAWSQQVIVDNRPGANGIIGMEALAKSKPPEVIQKVQRETARLLFAPDVRDRLSGLGAEPVGSTPAEFAAFLKAEADKWSRVTREAGIYHSQ